MTAFKNHLILLDDDTTEDKFKKVVASVHANASDIREIKEVVTTHEQGIIDLKKSNDVMDVRQQSILSTLQEFAPMVDAVMTIKKLMKWGFAAILALGSLAVALGAIIVLYQMVIN